MDENVLQSPQIQPFALVSLKANPIHADWKAKWSNIYENVALKLYYTIKEFSADKYNICRV